MPVFALTIALQMAPSGKLLVVPQETPEQDSVHSGPGAQPMGQESGPQAQCALKVVLPAPSPGSLWNKDSGPKVRSPLEECSSMMVRPGEISGARTLPTRLGREGSPGQQCGKTHTPRRGLASWDESLVAAQGGVLPGTKTPAREGGAGCSLTLPNVRAPSTPRDSVQLAKRHHSQPHVGPGHFSHVVSIEIGTLPALHPSDLPKVKAQVELREEPEKMEMEEQTPAGRKEERKNPKGPRAELEEVELGSKPPTPPLHRFPSWVRGHLGAGQRGRAEDAITVHRAQPRAEHETRLSSSWCLWEVGATEPAQTTQPARGRARIWNDWVVAGGHVLSKHSPCATHQAGCWMHVVLFNLHNAEVVKLRKQGSESGKLRRAAASVGWEGCVIGKRQVWSCWECRQIP